MKEKIGGIQSRSSDVDDESKNKIYKKDHGNVKNQT